MASVVDAAGVKIVEVENEGGSETQVQKRKSSTFVATHDFEARGDGERSVKKGEVVVGEPRGDNNEWVKCTQTGKHLPSNHLSAQVVDDGGGDGDGAPSILRGLSAVVVPPSARSGVILPAFEQGGIAYGFSGSPVPYSAAMQQLSWPKPSGHVSHATLSAKINGAAQSIHALNQSHFNQHHLQGLSYDELLRGMVRPDEVILPLTVSPGLTHDVVLFTSATLKATDSPLPIKEFEKGNGIMCITNQRMLFMCAQPSASPKLERMARENRTSRSQYQLNYMSEDSVWQGCSPRRRVRYHILKVSSAPAKTDTLFPRVARRFMPFALTGVHSIEMDLSMKVLSPPVIVSPEVHDMCCGCVDCTKFQRVCCCEKKVWHVEGEGGIPYVINTRKILFGVSPQPWGGRAELILSIHESVPALQVQSAVAAIQAHAPFLNGSGNTENN